MRSILITIVAMFWISLGFSQDLQVAKIGDFKTESGTVITDAKIGYRTIGTLNAKKDNAYYGLPGLLVRAHK